MVLLINEHVCSNKYSLDDLVKHLDLINLSSKFASSEEFQQANEEISKTIYVNQREYAVLANNDSNGFHLIGSDNATTCHILVLDNHAAVALAHLDGSETQKSIRNMLQELKKYAPQTTNYDVYLVGGFLDNSRKQYSRNLSNEVLNLFATMTDVSFNLKLAAITMHNDCFVSNIHFPIIYGICFDVKTKSIRKMNFIDYGPAFRLRSVYQSMNSQGAWCLYSSLDGKITLGNFQIDNSVVKDYFEPLYKYYFNDNQKLLSLTSTSPAQEKQTYIINMKKHILYILKYYKTIPQWFDRETNSIVYRWLNDKWTTNNTKIIEDVDMN